MRVGPADPEGRHAHPPGIPAVGPRQRPGRRLDRARRPVGIGRDLVGMQGGRQNAVPECHHGLDHSGDPGCGLCVTDVRLHGTDRQRIARLACRAVDRGQCLDLDRVAQAGASAVRLDQVDLAHRHTGRGQRVPHHLLLRRPGRSRRR